MKRTLVIMLMLIVQPLLIFSQDAGKKNLPFTIGTDLMSRYIWRGQCINKSPNIQPYLIYAPKFGLQVGAWGSYAFTGDYAEVDLFLSYGYGGFSATLTDYFVMDESMQNNHFFDYKKGSTMHVLEGALAYEGPENVPLKFTAATMFYGADQKVDNVVIDTVHNDTTAFYVNQFSTYFELSYKIRNISVFAGITPAAGYYGNGFGVVNLGITARKDLIITDKFTLPIQASLITNPQRQNIYLVFGFTF